MRTGDAAAKSSEGGQGIQKGEAMLKDSDRRENLGVFKRSKRGTAASVSP